MALNRVVSNGLNHIFVTETKNAAQMAIYQILPKLQGSNLSPLLFLVYINDLPNCLTSASPRIFADDTNITFAASTMAVLKNAVNLELRNLQRWLITNRLSLNIAKTEFIVIGSNQRIHALSKNQIDIEIEGLSIRKFKEAKSLGLFIDEQLSWAKHIEEISNKISSAIGALKRIIPFISESTLFKSTKR